MREKGLRGSFVVSRLHGQPRYLNRVELFALHGVPLTVSHLPDLRAALCLIGQPASPLQALWVFSHLCSLAAGHDLLCARPTALAALERVKRQMIRDHFQLFKHTNNNPRHLHVNLPEGAHLTSGATTVTQLLRAEAINLVHGEMMHICDGLRPLPEDQILLEQGAYGPYNMQITQGIDLEDPFGQFAIVFEAADDTHTHMWQYSGRDPFCFKQFNSARSTEYT